MKEIAVDCDGVLANFTDTILRDIGSVYAMKDIARYEVRSYLTPEQDAQAKARWKTAEWWRTLPVVEGAQAGIEKIRSADLEPIIVTSPWVSCEGWEYARRAWLKEHFGITHSEVIVCSRKYMVRAMALIEDSTDKLHDWAQSWTMHHPLLFDAPYNRAHDERLARLHRMHGWSDIDRVLEFIQ